MSDQPKVSERMERLVIAYALTVAYPTEPQKVNAARCALLSAIAEIEAERDALKAELSTLRERISSRADFLIQALNEGDGVYRS